MYDVLVIGEEPGGCAAAIRASQLGGHVALVESDDIGGAFVNCGRIPTKIWQRAAYLSHCMQRGNEFGLEVYLKSPDMSAIVARKKDITNDIRMGMEALLTNNGVELVRGRAIFKSAREIDVEGHLLTGEKISYRQAAP